MPLTPGTRLGPYEVVAPLGAGGMGEVYRARDTKLGRDVALKILPDAFASDPERLTRFEREAKTLASLNHPHIAQIHGFEDSAGTRALVMELVEGEDLARRIGRGPIPVDETVAIARQIANALEAAHEQGIIHRDLKPANIKLRPDGAVKVLDFGLAKAPVADTDAANSPTFTRLGQGVGDAGSPTELGVIIGTAAYMAPEQARGKAIDKRADIWAFGCVLYEMLTGTAPFAGETISDIIAAVLTREPDFAALPPATPPSVRRLLARCLQRDPKQRLRDIGDAALELDATREPAPARTVAAATRRAWLLPLAVAIAVAVTATLTAWLRRPASPPNLIRAVTIDGAGFADTSTVAISPDGGTIAFYRERYVGGELLVRPLHTFDTRAIVSQTIAVYPFFSPRGDAIAFGRPDTRALYRIPIGGGTPTQVMRVGETGPGVWLPDDTMIVSTARLGDRIFRGLVRVPASGGEPTPLTTTASPEEIHTMPSPLPGNRLILFTAIASGNHRLAVVDLETKQHRLLGAGLTGTTPRYVSSGHLVYFEPSLLQVRAVRFDPVRAEPLGEPVVVLENVHRGVDAIGSFEVSNDGHLFYSPLGSGGPTGFALTWAAPDKPDQKITDVRTTWAQPRLSPDGRRLVVRETSAPNCTAWIYDLERGSRTRLTGAVDPHNAFWHPDGRSVVFDALVDQGRQVFQWNVDGTQPPRRIATGFDGVETPRSISPDGAWLAVTRSDQKTGADVWAVPLTGGQARPLAASEFKEDYAAFSPDGRWIAYSSNDSGRDEVYVMPWPAADQKFQASTQGGNGAVWTRDSRRLFYTDGRRILAVDIATDGGTGRLRAGAPRLFIDGRVVYQRVGNYDVAPDGQRMVIVEGGPVDALRGRDLRVIFNWIEDLRQKVSAQPR